MAKFAVIETGGKQYCVREQELLSIEKIDGLVGEVCLFDKVLLIAEDDSQLCQVGAPYVEAVSVEAEVVEHGRAKKVTGVKYKSKVRYKRKYGHRQHVTNVRITKIPL